jgi:phage terminase large subunit-like protein
MVCGKTPLGKGLCGRLAIVAETAKDLRETIAKGPSGILSVHPPEFRPSYTEKGGFIWPNGATALIYNGTEPDQLRGPGIEAAWCDELAKWRYAQEAWDNLEYALRGGDNPKVLVTTTPRPLKIIKNMIDDKGTVVTSGSLYDNRANLPAKYVKKILDRYDGTRMGRQEIYGEVVDDVPGALWTRATLDKTRIKSSERGNLPDMQRIVVAIDPAAKKSEDEDDTAETGIIVAAVGVDGRGYVLDDFTCRLGPKGWAGVAVAAYDEYEADFIVAEVNQGGDMVEAVIKAVRSSIKVEKVHASRGKVVRAEPVSALYEQGRISHVGSFAALEDQMVMFTPWGIENDSGSDRADALVWALTELFPVLVKREKRKPRQRYRQSSNEGRSRTTGY